MDDTVYGSLTVYREEIAEELHRWMDNHSEEEMDAAVRNAIATLDMEEQTAYTSAWNEILSWKAM